jgi:hypothetical protein
MEIAKTILQQLGGNKFLAMTGAKNLMSDGNKLHMTLPKNMSKANRLTITLDPNDTYQIRFFKLTGGKLNMKTFEYSEIKEKDIKVSDGIYADQLQDIFTSITGMYTHL